MAIDIRLPNINADTDHGRMAQMQSYMYQLVEQLNWAFATITNISNGDTSRVQYGDSGSAAPVVTQQDAMTIFDSIKGLIIKSGEVITAYEEKFQADFVGVYAAKKDYDMFTQQTSNQLMIDSENITQNYSKIETIIGEIEAIRTNVGYIRSGVIDAEGKVGIEIGQENGNGFSRWARFTADGIYFFPDAVSGDADPIAYLTSDRLVVTNAYIATLRTGGYAFDTSSGLAFKWVGR